MKEQELKACPFCGGEAVMKVGLHHFHDVEISCSECGATGEMFDVDDGVRNEVKYNKEGAIEAWNRRTEPEWQPIETAPLGEQVLLFWSASKHMEDGAMYDDGLGPYHVLFDGEQLNDHPTHWKPLPAAPNSK